MPFTADVHHTKPGSLARHNYNQFPDRSPIHRWLSGRSNLLWETSAKGMREECSSTMPCNLFLRGGGGGREWSEKALQAPIQ